MASQPPRAWTESHALIERPAGTYLIARPRDGDDTPWEFPGGRVETSESPEGGLRRVVRDRLGVELELLIGQPPFVYNFGSHSITYRYYLCALRSRPEPLGYAELRWVKLGQLRDYIFDPATQQVVDWLLEEPKKE